MGKLVSNSCSEGIVVTSNQTLDLVEAVERLEHSIFEDGVELVFERGDQGGRLETVETHVFEVCIPVEALQLEQFEAEDNLRHARLHLRLTQILIHYQFLASLSGHFPGSGVKPSGATFKALRERNHGRSLKQLFAQQHFYLLIINSPC